ncbi:hypothetical protein C0992_007129 [Termitomyces sp. T32_za158]|nr:hypothetical protein C0992_007129 [Termitomyces sp. T32_za158]
MVATENYSSWYGKHIGHPTKVKREAPAENRQDPLKRPTSIPPMSSEEPVMKKIKSSNHFDIALKTAIFSSPEAIARLTVPHSTSSTVPIPVSSNAAVSNSVIEGPSCTNQIPSQPTPQSTVVDRASISNGLTLLASTAYSLSDCPAAPVPSLASAQTPGGSQLPRPVITTSTCSNIDLTTVSESVSTIAIDTTTSSQPVPAINSSGTSDTLSTSPTRDILGNCLAEHMPSLAIKNRIPAAPSGGEPPNPSVEKLSCSIGAQPPGPLTRKSKKATAGRGMNGK